MANSYLPWDLGQPFLLPPDMREWLPADHLVFFIRAVVEEVDTAVLHERHPRGGPGRRAYDPDMLLGVLIYAYCTRVRSSRQIERLCEVDVAYRVLAGGQLPDHTTIARFRQQHETIAGELFVEVLLLCRQAGLAAVGVVAVDGTKMGCQASLASNRSEEWLRGEVAGMLREAGEVDAAEDAVFGDARGDELPVELSDPRSRKARIQEAVRQLQQRREHGDQEHKARLAKRERLEHEAAARGERPTGRPPQSIDLVADAEAAYAHQQAREAKRRAEVEARWAVQGRQPPGAAPKEATRVRLARERLERERARARAAAKGAADTAVDTDTATRQRGQQINISDPDSRTMTTRKGWVQGYNAQAAVNERGVVVGVDVTQDANDLHQLEPMIATVDANLAAIRARDPVGILLFDAGYLSEHNLTAPGPDRLIATAKRRQAASAPPASGRPAASASPKEAMAHRLRTPEGAALYAKRAAIVEPVFGQTKSNRGFDRFVRRGLAAVKAEWLLIHTAHNLLKIFNLNPATATAG